MSTHQSHSNINHNNTTHIDTTTSIGQEIISLIIQKPSKFYIFPISFEKLWSLVKDPSKYSLITTNLSPGIFLYPIKLSKNKFFEINNEFLIEIDNTIEANFKTISLIETDYFCSIIWNFSTNIDNTSFSLTVSLSKLNQDQTLYQLSFNLLTSTSIPISSYPPTFSILLNKRFNIYTYYTKLNNYINTSYQTQTESSLISAKFKIAKEYFLNSKVCTLMMGEYVSSTEERVKKGTIVVYINNQDNKKWLIHVRQCIIKKMSCLLMFFIYEANHSSYPMRELRVELFGVNDNETFVILTHNFIKPITNEEIQTLSNAKKKMLKKLGSVIERSFMLNYKEGNISDGE